MDKFITRNKNHYVQMANGMEEVAEERMVSVEVHRDFDGNVCMTKTPSLRVNQHEMPAMTRNARKRRYAVCRCNATLYLTA